MNASSWVTHWAAERPSAVALVDLGSGESMTWEALATRVERAAAGLVETWGIKRGDRVALLCGTRQEVFLVALACARVGAALVPLNWRLAPAELVGILADCRPAVLVHDPAFASLAGELAGPLGLERVELAAFVEGLPGAVLPPPADEPEGVAMILYTSGTTGRPKGAMLPHRQPYHNALHTEAVCGLTPADRALACLPLFHTGGLHCLAYPCLYVGATVVVAERFDPVETLRVLADEAITVSIAVPTMYKMLLDAGLPPHATLPALRLLLCGGAPCPPTLLRAYWALGHTLRQGYGLTEVGPNCFALGPGGEGGDVASVGLPALPGSARLVDTLGQAVPAGEVGELELRGPHVCLGYFERPEATAEALRGGWFRTGDLARMMPDGAFTIVGRHKEMFISGGENVYPAEVEAALLDHPSVVDACVFGLPDPRWGEVGAAVLTLKPGVSLDSDALRTYLRGRLAGYKVPRRFLAVEALPRTASGKVDRVAVRQLWQAPPA